MKLLIGGLIAQTQCPIFMHVPPVQLSPIEQEWPQLPQLLLSEMKDVLLTHCPMQDV